MIDHTTALYCIVDDLLKAVGHKDDCRRELTDAEVVTSALVAAFNFGGNSERSRSFPRGTRRSPRPSLHPALSGALLGVVSVSETAKGSSL